MSKFFLVRAQSHEATADDNAYAAVAGHDGFMDVAGEEEVRDVFDDEAVFAWVWEDACAGVGGGEVAALEEVFHDDAGAVADGEAAVFDALDVVAVVDVAESMVEEAVESGKVVLAMDVDDRGVRDEVDVGEFVEVFGELLVDARLWFGDAAGVVVAGADNDLLVFWDHVEVACEFFVLGVDVRDVEFFFLSGKYSDAFNDVAGEEDDCGFFGGFAFCGASVFSTGPFDEVHEAVGEEEIGSYLGVAGHAGVDFVR